MSSSMDEIKRQFVEQVKFAPTMTSTSTKTRNARFSRLP